MRRMCFFVLALCISVSFGSSPYSVRAQPTSSLLSMLRFIPDTPEYNGAVSFGDIAAWKTSWNMPPISTYADVEKLDKYQRAYWASILPRQTFPPSALSYLPKGQVQETYGFDLQNIERFVVSGAGLRGLMLAEHATTTQAIASKLESANYFAQDSRLGELYSLGNHLAGLNNIWLIPDNRLLVSAEIDAIGLSNAALNKQIPSLADNADYQAVATFLEDETLTGLGELTMAVFMNGDNLSAAGPALVLKPGTIPAKAQSEIERITRGWLPLSPYDLAVFATFHGDGYSYQVVLLSFSTDVNAKLQADAVMARIKELKPDFLPKKYMEYYELDAYDTFGLESQDKQAAVVILRAANPPLEFPAGSLNPPNSVPTRVPAWEEILLKYEYGFLAVTDIGEGISS